MINQYEQDLKVISAALDLLGEQFDAVQIFCSRHEPATDNGTVHYHDGCGNEFARLGQVIHWLERERERTRLEERELNQDDDDGEVA